MRVRVYVDGMNLYYGSLKSGNGAQYKWLNLVDLARKILPPECDVAKVLYFTSLISKVSHSNAKGRQKAYIDALKSLDEVEVYYGNFLPRTIWRPLASLPVANQEIAIEPPVTLPEGNHRISGNRRLVIPVRTYKKRNLGRQGWPKHSAPVPNAVFVEVHTREEKGSDVNLAAHLLNDAWYRRFDAAAVISNDTDLVTPIRMVREERSKPVYIICPRQEVAKELKDAATDVFFISLEHLREAQFPEIVANNISKPECW